MCEQGMVTIIQMKKQKSSSNYKTTGWIRASKVMRIFITVVAIFCTPIAMLIFRPALTPFALTFLWGMWWLWRRFFLNFEENERNRLEEK
jgi:hypothetical protein